jgi:hypothetical protein
MISSYYSNLNSESVSGVNETASNTTAINSGNTPVDVRTTTSLIEGAGN